MEEESNLGCILNLTFSETDDKEFMFLKMFLGVYQVNFMMRDSNGVTSSQFSSYLLGTVFPFHE